MRVEALVLRQQRRVDVEQPARESLDEARGEDAHESGERDELVRRSRRAPSRARRRRTSRSANCLTGTTLTGTPSEAARAMPPAVSRSATTRTTWKPASGALRRAHDRLHVAAAAGDHHRHGQHPSIPRRRRRACRARPAPITAAVSPEARSVRERRIDVGRRHHDDHADAAVEGAVHLGQRDLAGRRAASRTPASRGQLLRCSTTSRPSGSTRGMLSVRPPPVMCAKPFTAPSARARASTSRRCAWARAAGRTAPCRRPGSCRSRRRPTRACGSANSRSSAGRTKPGRSRRRPPRSSSRR